MPNIVDNVTTNIVDNVTTNIVDNVTTNTTYELNFIGKIIYYLYIQLENCICKLFEIVLKLCFISFFLWPFIIIAVSLYLIIEGKFNIINPSNNTKQLNKFILISFLLLFSFGVTLVSFLLLNIMKKITKSECCKRMFYTKIDNINYENFVNTVLNQV